MNHIERLEKPTHTKKTPTNKRNNFSGLQSPILIGKGEMEMLPHAFYCYSQDFQLHYQCHYLQLQYTCLTTYTDVKIAQIP